MKNTMEAVGVFYCVTHEGVANEDDYECDFALSVGGDDCDFRRCFIEPRDG